MGYVHIQLPPVDRTKDFDTNYWYWHHLWLYFTDKFSYVTIQCWNEETTAIAELKNYTNLMRSEGLVKEFKIDLNERTRQFFAEEAAFDSKLKWFNLFFHEVAGKEGLELHDYGREISFNRLTRGDAEDIVEFFNQYQADVKFIPDEQD